MCKKIFLLPYLSIRLRVQTNFSLSLVTRQVQHKYYQVLDRL